MVAANFRIITVYGIGANGHCTCGKGAECSAPGKHPRGDAWQEKATSDLDTIQTWAERHKPTNWGALADGFVIIDIDPKKGGFESLREFEHLLTPTLTQNTGSGGRHYVYRLPDGVSLGNGKIAWKPGIDVLVGNRQFVVAPSRHVSGGLYGWVDLDVPVVELPQGVLAELLAARGSTGGGSIQVGDFNLSNILAGLPQGERDAGLFRYACWLRRMFRDDRQLVLFNALAMNQRCVPPMDEADVRTKVDSAFKQDHDTVRSEATAWVKMLDHGVGWDRPIPLASTKDLPPFPVESLPPELRRWCEAQAESLQMPVDLCFAMALATLMAALVGRVHVKVKPGWSEHPSLYVLGLHPPGSRKSVLAKRAFKPLFLAQAEMRERVREQRLRALAESEVLKHRVKAAQKAMSKSPDDPDVAEALRVAQYNLATHVIPADPLLVVNDVTPEALGIIMQEQGERIALLDSEGGSLITAVGARFGKDGQSNLDLVLKSWSGDAVAVHRVGRAAVVMQSPCLTIGGILQPAVLEELRGVNNADDRGLIQRCVIFAPADLMGARKMRTPDVPDEVDRHYSMLVGTLVDNLWPLAAPVVVSLAHDAADLLLQWQELIEPRLSVDGDLRDLSEYLNKLGGTAVRIALILHLARDPLAGLSSEISEPVMRDALGIANYLVMHFKFATRLAGLSSLATYANRLLKWLEGRAEFSRRDAYRHLRISDKEATPVLDLLEEHAFIRAAKTERPRGMAGRSPSQQYEVHPDLWSEESK